MYSHLQQCYTIFIFTTNLGAKPTSNFTPLTFSHSFALHTNNFRDNENNLLGMRVYTLFPHTMCLSFFLVRLLPFMPLFVMILHFFIPPMIRRHIFFITMFTKTLFGDKVKEKIRVLMHIQKRKKKREKSSSISSFEFRT
jgi:hypothetical protein